MYSVFEKLCKEKGVTPSAVAIACGFAPSVVSRWKSGESNPKADKLKKIADYFGVSLQYLMTGENPGGDFKGIIDAMVGGLDYFIPANDTVNLIVETINKWKPDQQKRLLKQIEQINAIIGENS